MADDASTGLYHKVQTQLAQHGEYLVQAQRWLALFEGMNKARGHIGKRCEFALSQPQLKSSAPDLIGPERRIICSIVHKWSLPGAQPATPQAKCTITHIACTASLSSPRPPCICSIVHTSGVEVGRAQGERAGAAAGGLGAQPQDQRVELGVVAGGGSDLVDLRQPKVGRGTRFPGSAVRSSGDRPKRAGPAAARAAGPSACVSK
jgi:hypothetical protein